jgi:hypothetical protein
MTLLISRKTATHRELYADKRIINSTTNTVKSNKSVKVFNGDNFLVASSGIVGHHVVFEIIDRMISLSIKLNLKNAVKLVTSSNHSNKVFPSRSSWILRFSIQINHPWLKTSKWKKVTQVSEKGGCY